MKYNNRLNDIIDSVVEHSEQLPESTVRQMESFVNTALNDWLTPTMTE